jgi:imidazolonepropionase-like amidohydrolase
MITLVNARLGMPTPVDGWLQIDEGLITAFGPGEPPQVEEVVDVAGQWVLPGFVDTHCHGGGGAALYSGNPDDSLLGHATYPYGRPRGRPEPPESAARGGTS